MPFSVSVQRSYTFGQTTLSLAELVTDDSAPGFDGQIAAGGTNVQVAFAITRANLKALAIKTDQAITIKTNSSGSPTDTITLVGPQCLVWTLQTDTLSKCPFSADVTQIFVTNATGLIANLQIYAITHQHS